MKRLAILTPSFAPDFESFVRLHNSVVSFADDRTIHHVVVPQRDLALFQSIKSPFLQVWPEREFLPPGMIPTARLAAICRGVPVLPRTFNCSAVNLRRLWPPVRGWVLQQILKLGAATHIECDGVVIIDSDVVLVRPMPGSMFFRGDVVRAYENPHAITSGLPRHLLWTRAAYDLLGLPWTQEVDFPDYVGGIVSWDPKVVAACLERVSNVSGTDWATAITKHLHFSELVLYGTYLRHFGSRDERSFSEPNTLCHSYWQSTPLSLQKARQFALKIGEMDVALHIQSNSGTAGDVFESALAVLTSGDSK